MSGAAIVEGLALVGVVITSVPVLSSLFNPKPDSSTTTKVRMIAGDGDFTEGNVPWVTLFDRSGTIISYSGVGKKKFKSDIIHKGQPHDVSITQDNKDASANGAEYLSLTASGDNAVCISILTVTTPTGVEYSWMGDVAKQCDVPWSYGNVVASISAQGEVRPAWIWLDNDATNEMKTRGVGMHLPSFQSNSGREGDYQNHTDRMCHSDPRFKVYDQLTPLDSIPYFKEPVYNTSSLVDFGDKALDKSNWATKENNAAELIGLFGTVPLKKRQTPANSWGRPGLKIRGRTEKAKRPAHLVVTTFGAHSAKELCESSTSWGPDLVNPKEGYYCDMEDKTLWEVCKGDEVGQKKSNCFDMETNSLRLSGWTRLVRRSDRKYTEIKQWK